MIGKVVKILDKNNFQYIQVPNIHGRPPTKEFTEKDKYKNDVFVSFSLHIKILVIPMDFRQLQSINLKLPDSLK